jgi:glycosyltransferase involved in cell wall biosynthesis
VDKIHAVSDDAKDNLLRYVPSLRFFREKVVPILNGVEVGRFLDNDVRDLRNELGLPNSTFLIGFLGRFMSPKGFVYLVEALRILLQEPNMPKQPVVLTFGEGAFIREEKAYVRSKRMEQYIYFMPFTPNVASTLKGLDVIAMPSVWEACGLLAMEAMVSGVPVIGTNCIGLREVLKNTPATSVPVRDSRVLAAALVNEIKNPSKPQAQAFIPEAALRFDIRNQTQKLEKIMVSLMRRTKCKVTSHMGKSICSSGNHHSICANNPESDDNL